MHMLRPFLRLSLAVACVAIVPSQSLQAQILSAYGTFSPIRISNIATGNTTGLNYTYSTSTYWAYGVSGGLTYSPVHIGPLSLGLDARASTSRQKQGADLLLVGIKAGLNLPVIQFKPYVQASGGYVGTRATITTGFPAGSTGSNGFYAYEILGGVDYALLPHLDIRLGEIGAGQGYYRSGPNSNIPNISFLTINTGVVLHF